MGAEVFDTLLLLALPASGKSEVRRYLRHLPAERRVREYHLGETVQLDDFPYVHFLRVVDETLERLGHPRLFYQGADQPFVDGRDWGTLLELVTEDYRLLREGGRPPTDGVAPWLFERIDRARTAAGAPAALSSLDDALRDRLAAKVEDEAQRLVAEQFARQPDDWTGHTVVIEFARGGPEGTQPPFAPPHGYAWSLKHLGADILERAAILYIWVTPEQSRRKNIERADPNDPGSILHHSCPEPVMRSDYGSDDFGWLLEHSDVPGTVRVEAHGRVFHVPAVRFDNRDDRTTFLRAEPESWPPEAVAELDAALRAAFAALWERYSKQR